MTILSGGLTLMDTAVRLLVSLGSRYWPRLRVACLAISLAILGLPGSAGAQTSAVALWEKADEDCPRNDLSEQARHCITVKMHGEVLERSNVQLLRLELPDGPVEASRIEVRPVSKQAFIWHGSVKGNANSSITFAVGKNAVVGVITLSARTYRLRSLGKGVSIVELLDSSKIPSDAEAPRAQSRKLMMGAAAEPTCYEGNPYGCMPPPGQCWTDSPHRIDVMVLYTDAARQAVGDDEGDDDEVMNLWISLHEYWTNYSYIQSNAAQRIQIVHRQLVTYEESGGLSYARQELTLQCDAKLNEAHSLRDQFKADIVVLITHIAGLGGGGQARTMQEDQVGNYSFEPCAFGVVQVSQYLDQEYYFAHELGHLMGAQHDIGSALSPGAIRDSSYGHFEKSRSTDQATGSTCEPWMTIMTTRSSCDECDSNGNCVECERKPFWSNPTLSHCGKTMGGKVENNRDTLDHTALTVANFRCSSPTPSNVWMKDAWDDTGVEPDPNLAAEPMWKSPYIWIRNTPDTSSMFEKRQHQHEDPVTGQTNYIYVKVHNSGNGSIGGTLQVWAAKGSTGLSWPSSFTEVGSFDVLFSTGVTRIIEFPWTPSESGEFSLIARWRSAADPMTNAETAQVDANVRGNNNIVWRKVDIVGE